MALGGMEAGRHMTISSGGPARAVDGVEMEEVAPRVAPKEAVHRCHPWVGPAHQVTKSLTLGMREMAEVWRDMRNGSADDGLLQLPSFPWPYHHSVRSLPTHAFHSISGASIR